VPGELGFWKKVGFRQTTRIMFAYPIDDVIGWSGWPRLRPANQRKASPWLL